MKTPRMAFAAVLCSALALPALAQSSMPMPSGAGGAAASALAVGTIRGIDVAQHILTIEHQAIPRMNMSGMTMDFRLDKSLSTEGLSIGQPIAFILSPSSDGIAINEVQPIGVSGATPGTSMPQHNMQGHDTSSMKMSGKDKKMMARCHEMMMKSK